MVLCGSLAFPSVTLELKRLHSLPAARITAPRGGREKGPRSPAVVLCSTRLWSGG